MCMWVPVEARGPPDVGSGSKFRFSAKAVLAFILWVISTAQHNACLAFLKTKVSHKNILHVSLEGTLCKNSNIKKEIVLNT